ncbi:hypothetical protein M8J75_000427 [Diaphorina citri]|nr:hypothetical protein M8J75_000427 [Diaphorina citri]
MREEMGEWRFCLVFLLAIVTSTAASGCPQDSPDRNLLCYQTKFTEEELEPCLCTHWVLTRELLDEKDYLVERNEDLQIILSVETGETNLTQEIFHEGVQGIELSTLWTKTPKQLVKYVKSIVEELHQSSSDLSRSKRSYSVRENEPTTEEDDLSTVVTDSEILKSTVNTARDTASSTETVLSLEDADNNLFGDRTARDDSDQKLMLIMRLPSNAMFLAKHYDLKGLARYVDLFVLNTDNIVETRANDSLVDLITGLGIPKDKLVLAFPTHAYQFQLANASLSLPQSPALGAPKLLTQAQLCKLTKQGNWTTERDEDLTAPYTFQNNTWIAFDDEMSASIKSKYIALSNLAGAAIMDIQDQDWSHQCGGEKGQAPALVRTLYDTFTQVIRKPRQTQLLELQQQLHEHSIDAPTRVVRVVDHEGATHVVRRDVVVNFQCSRQGYFVHPTGCNRFYRCVKFNQYTDDWTVFEYDCPAGLAFDERWEVCVWPGSLPDGGACQGSSEIAPVPRNRFQCPAQPGYYADPENCRWFFACLDHAGDGVTPLTAYEFRCPFSLVFNEQTLVCDWPWNVQGCGEWSSL